MPLSFKSIHCVRFVPGDQQLTLVLLFQPKKPAPKPKPAAKPAESKDDSQVKTLTCIALKAQRGQSKLI